MYSHIDGNNAVPVPHVNGAVAIVVEFFKSGKELLDRFLLEVDKEFDKKAVRDAALAAQKAGYISEAPRSVSTARGQSTTEADEQKKAFQTILQTQQRNAVRPSEHPDGSNLWDLRS